MLLFPLGALFAALFAVYWADGDVRKSEDSVDRMYAMRDTVTGGRSALLDAEAATAGYLSTPNPRFLTAFANARGRLEAALARLPGLAGGDAAVLGQLRGIAGLAEAIAAAKS